MHRYEVTTPWHGPGYSNNGATRSGKFAVRDSRTPDGGALSFSLDKWQTFVAEVQAMAPDSLRRVGREPHAEVVCDAITE